MADTDAWVDYDPLLSVSPRVVRENFKRFHVWDKRYVKFVEGDFVHALPLLRASLLAEGRSIAVLHGDGDMYESYMDILYNLYDLLAVGGFFVCDDCRIVPEADRAVMDFRRTHEITEDLFQVDGSADGIFWRKERVVRVEYESYLAWNDTRTLRKKPLATRLA